MKQKFPGVAEIRKMETEELKSNLELFSWQWDRGTPGAKAAFDKVAKELNARGESAMLQTNQAW